MIANVVNSRRHFEKSFVLFPVRRMIKRSSAGFRNIGKNYLKGFVKNGFESTSTQVFGEGVFQTSPASQISVCQLVCDRHRYICDLHGKQVGSMDI